MKQKIEVAKEFSAIILAAGKSSRMGFPKLSLQVDKNTIFIEQIVKVFEAFGCKEIVVVVNSSGNDFLLKNSIQFPQNVKIVLNQNPEWHRFYSLKMGMQALSENRSVFVHNVDNPFVNKFVLNKLSDESNNAEYVNPQYNGIGGHPFLLSNLIVENIKSIKENQLHLKEFLGRYNRLRVDVDDERILTNINTIEEYKRYFSS